MGVPGTPGPKPAGLTRGEPAGARFTGAWTPGGVVASGAADQLEGPPANSAFAICAISAGSNGGAEEGAAADDAEGMPKVLTAAYL